MISSAIPTFVAGFIPFCPSFFFGDVQGESRSFLMVLEGVEALVFFLDGVVGVGDPSNSKSEEGGVADEDRFIRKSRSKTIDDAAVEVYRAGKTGTKLFAS